MESEKKKKKTVKKRKKDCYLRILVDVVVFLPRKKDKKMLLI